MANKYIAFILGLFLLGVACEEDTEETTSFDIIAVTPLQLVITVGETIQFTAEAKDVDLNTVTGVTFTWTSSDPQAVSINDQGLATGLAMASEVVIIASAEDVESNDAVVSVAGDPATIDLGVTSEAVVVGKSITLSGNIKDALGTSIPGAQITGWIVGDETLLSVSAGIVTGLAKGETTIRATMNSLQSDSVRIYIWDVVFTEDFSAVDTSTIGDYYFRGKNGIIWQINHDLDCIQMTDSTCGTGMPAVILESGNPVLRLTESRSYYFTNRQLLIMTYGSTTYDSEYMWPTRDGILTKPNFRVQMRIKGMDDPVAGRTAESLVVFTQYFSGAASPYYLVYAPGRNRVSAWFGASLAPGAPIPDWGAMPQITYDQWFNAVVEVFDGTMRTEVFTGAEPTGEWDYTYTIPDWTGEEENIPGFWFGAFLVDEYYADDIIYYTY